MEKVNPEPGTVRLEARVRYLTKVTDAIVTTLSKHDQILVPSSTRLGRVHASSVSVCIACDRPLKSRSFSRRGGSSLDCGKPGEINLI